MFLDFLQSLQQLTTSTLPMSEISIDSLLKGGNAYRWIEYAISSTLMIIVVASLSGIRDVRSLYMIASANIAVMIKDSFWKE